MVTVRNTVRSLTAVLEGVVVTTSLIRRPTDAAQRSKAADELDGVVTALCVKYPHRERAEIEDVVANAYARISEHATVHAHLIPLTLNRSSRILRQADSTPPAPVDTFRRDQQ